MKKITGYNHYYVTCTGKVISRNPRNGKGGNDIVLIPKIDKDGYEHVTLCRNNKRKTYRVHRLIATEFLDAPSSDLTTVNHKDEDKRNNRVDNLEWCDTQYNTVYSLKPRKFLIRGVVHDIQSISKWCKDTGMCRRNFYRLACAI